MRSPARALGRTAALSAALAAGCGGPPRQPWDVTGDRVEGYARTLDAWTRKGEAYESFEGRLFATATCGAPSFERALAQRRAEREGWTTARLDAAQAEVANQAAVRLRCLVAVAAQTSLWDDAGPGGSLQFSLQSPSGPVPATTARKLNADETADLVPYFTWLTPLQSAFWVEFPAQSPPERLTLRISGPPALIDLNWKVPP